MEIEEEIMFEEHLDEDVLEEEAADDDEEEATEEHEIDADVVTSYEKRSLEDKRRKLLLLLSQHLQNFQRAILTSRRRCQQRLRRRQLMLRAYYVQQLLAVEASFVEILPLPGCIAVDSATEPDTDENQVPYPMATTTNSTTTSAQTLRRRTATALRFYEHIVADFCDEQWLFAFRLSKRTFRWLCAQLRETLPLTDHAQQLGNIMSLEKRVTMALYAFATGDDYRSVAVLFDVSSHTVVAKFVRSFAEAVLQKLSACLLAMPQREQDYREIRESLQRASNMPAAAVGVLGHVNVAVNAAVSPPTDDTNVEETILLQTLIDDRLLFRKVQVELTQRRPSLFLDAPNEISTLPPQQINDDERLLPCFVVADASAHYPLRPWLMQPYDEPIAPHEYDFNEAVDNLLLIRERAFRRLFARWKIIQRKSDLDARTMEKIVIAGCALHNLLEEQQEQFLPEWAEGVEVSFFDGCGALLASAADVAHSEEVLDIRDYLARTISSTEM